MSIQLILSGDLLVVVEEDSYPDPVEEAARRGAWIICHGPFSKNNREIGYKVMRQMLEEADRPWPRPHEDAPAIETMMKSLEAGTISEAKFVDWVCVRVATA